MKLSNTEKNQEIAASKAGMDPKTARGIWAGTVAQRTERRNARGGPGRIRSARCGTAVQEQMQESPGLEAKTLFEWLQREYPGRFATGRSGRCNGGSSYGG